MAEIDMSDFNKDQALSHYHELSMAEDELVLQGRMEDAKSIHRREIELEQEAMENGYILTVRFDSVLISPDEETCWIREMTPEERQLFLAQGRRAVYNALQE